VKMLRLVYSLGIYLILALAYAVAAMWVNDGYVLDPSEKGLVLFIGLLVSLPVALVLEGADVRKEILDALLDKGDDE